MNHLSDFPPIIGSDSKSSSNSISAPAAVAPTWQQSTAPKFTSQDFPSLSNRPVPTRSISPAIERPNISSDDKNFPKLPAANKPAKKEKKKTNLPEHIAGYFQETLEDETFNEDGFEPFTEQTEITENTLNDKRAKKAKKKQVLIKFG